jgi:hypothetical protein
MPRRRPFLALLILIALLGLAGSAQALALPGPSDLRILAVPADEEEEAEASEGEEEAEVEECDFEEEECGEDESRVEAPPECLLTSVKPTISLAGNSHRIRLQVRYTASSPAPVVIAYGLHGTKGSLFLGKEKKRFGKKGVLRLSRSLTEAQMAKVTAAKDFTVRIRALETPGWCQSIFDRHLTLRRTTPSGLSWQERE